MLRCSWYIYTVRLAPRQPLKDTPVKKVGHTLDTCICVQYSETMRPTNKQRSLLRLIAIMTESKGHSPTMAEIAERLEIQPSAVHCRLRVLKNKAWVTWVPKVARTLRITEGGSAHVRSV